MLQEGLEFSSQITVTEALTAKAMGSGDMSVFATPAMIALMENAAMLAVAESLNQGDSTVGTMISASHVKASGLGEIITSTAVLTKIEGRMLTFKVSASDSVGLIGEGEHTRFVVNKEKFLAKISK